VYASEFTEPSSFALIEALVWQLRAGSAENWGQDIPPDGAQKEINILKVPFQWSPGFRLGLGHVLKNNGWDTAFYYTHYQTNGTDQARVSSGGIFSPFLGNFFVNNTSGGSITASPNYGSANIKWKFFFNTFDLELGRRFKIDKLLQLRPFIGLKSGIINNHISSSWQNPTNTNNFTSAVENLKNDFWGIGPTLGLDTSWHVYKTPKTAINIFGNFSGALMWGHWQFSDLYQNNANVSVAVNSSSFNNGCTMGRALLGIQWEKLLASSKFGIRIGYEIQVWYNQMQYYSYNEGRLSNLISLQGGVLGMYFNF